MHNHIFLLLNKEGFNKFSFSIQEKVIWIA